MPILGECKYWQEPVGANILRELEQKAEHVSWNKDHRQTWLVLFSMGGFTDELKQLAEGRTDLLLVDDREYGTASGMCSSGSITSSTALHRR